MSLPERSIFFGLTNWIIRKRVFVVFVLLVFLGAGVLCYQNLPLEAFPDVANMQVRVITQVPGKAPEEVERLVTIPIEHEVNGIPHSRPPRSISIFGLSVVTVVFDDKAEPNVARQQVLERIFHADLPDGIEPELDPNASPVGEIYRYTVQGKDWSSLDKKEVQDWLLNRLFKSVDGIVDSTGFGGPTKIYLVELDPGRLRALGLSTSDVAAAISRSNGSTGGSYIVSNDQRYMVRGLGLLKDASSIANVVLASRREGIPVRVKDVAHVQVDAAVRKGQVGLNNDDDVVEGILMMTRGDNPSRAIANLHSAWADVVQQLPEGMELAPLYDRTRLVHKTMETIGRNVAEGVVLVVVILMLFLFQVRSALVCSIVIPGALLGACIILRVFNIPANLLSLGAIDFGIIVDGAVILVENINRKLAEGAAEGEAWSPVLVQGLICAAVAEVAKPIVFATAIISMTFLPILSFEHVEGRLFKPLAIMMNLNLLMAVLCTLLVVPAVCYFVFVRKAPVERESPIVVFLEHWFAHVIPVVQRHGRMVLAGFVCLTIAALSLLPFVGAEFIPELEEGNIWLTVTILPPSVTLEKSVQIAREIRRVIATYPEAGNVLTQIGSPDDGTDPNPYNLIEVLVDLKPQGQWREQFVTKDDLVNAMDKEINDDIPGLVCNFSQCIKDSMEEAMSGVKNGEYAIKVFGKDIGTLERLAEQVCAQLKTVPGIEDIAHDLLMGQPQLTIEVDQERADRLGITAQQVLDVVETAIGGKAVSKLIAGERRFDIVLRLKEEYRADPKHVGDILVATPAGAKIPLKELATITQSDGANSIVRENNKRRCAAYANIRGRDLGSAVLESQRNIAANVHLPAGYSIEYAGEFERAREAGQRLLIIVPVTLLLIFLTLYLAFDSAGMSLLAMGAVPVATSVACIVMFVTGTHLSVSSGVGLVALLGLSIQNAVIVISRLRDILAEGAKLDIAVAQASVGKMNAVIIAALVAAVGLMPAAHSTGIGSQSQKPFATVIAFGILPSTALTLLLIPALAPVCLAPRKRGRLGTDDDLDDDTSETVSEPVSAD